MPSHSTRILRVVGISACWCLCSRLQRTASRGDRRRLQPSRRTPAGATRIRTLGFILRRMAVLRRAIGRGSHQRLVVRDRRRHRVAGSKSCADHVGHGCRARIGRRLLGGNNLDRPIRRDNFHLPWANVNRTAVKMPNTEKTVSPRITPSDVRRIALGGCNQRGLLIRQIFHCAAPGARGSEGPVATILS